VLFSSSRSQRSQYFFGDKENETFTKESLRTFVENYRHGDLEPFLFTEDLTDEEMRYTEKTIGKLTARNYNEVTNNHHFVSSSSLFLFLSLYIFLQKHVVYFTHKDCAECKTYDAKFQQLFSEHSDLFSSPTSPFRFYSIDCGRNQIPEDVPSDRTRLDF
jgi:hypothetical protein